MATKNVAGKSRNQDNPYAQWTDPLTGWEFKLLKSYQVDNNKEYGRWFMAVKSENTFGTWELGDGYVAEYRRGLNRAINAGLLKVDENVWEIDERGYSGQFAAWAWGER